MTLEEAKNIVRQYLEKNPVEECPLVWVGDVYVETADSFIFDVAFYAAGDNPKNWEHSYCAIHKTTGKCGDLLPVPGPELTKEDFENFSWDNNNNIFIYFRC